MAKINVNVVNVQKQIKAFNKALSRAESADSISDTVYAAVMDLIDYDRMTQGGYGKAGSKYLESLSPDELLSYSADIQQAKDLLEMEKVLNQFDTDIELANMTDPKAALWKLKEDLEAEGFPFDYRYVQQVTSGEKDMGFSNLYKHMLKLYTDKEYNMSDFDEWYNNAEGI
jgi:hypothetical protein